MTWKPSVRVNATDVRVRFGEMLRRLETEDIIVEKGGVPVARLTRYQPEPAMRAERPQSVRYITEEAHEAEQAVWDAEEGIMAEIEAIRRKYAGAGEKARARPTEADWEKALAAMREGWSIDGDELIADIYRWRDEGSRLNRYYTVTDDGELKEVGDDRTEEPARGQRRADRRRESARYVADGDDAPYRA